MVRPSVKLTAVPPKKDGHTSEVKRHKWLVDASGRAVSWNFSIRDRRGQVVHQLRGAGGPPRVIEWNPQSIPTKGQYGAVLTLIGSRQLVQSAPAWFAFGEPVKPVEIARTVSISGYRASIDSKEHFQVVARLKRGAPLLFDLQDQHGRWLALVPVDQKRVRAVQGEPDELPNVVD